MEHAGRALERLDVLVGAWSMEAAFPSAPPSGEMGRTVFEWMSGKRFLVQRWEVAHPQAPDGLAVIGSAPDGDGFVQHYFDSRGIARVYAMQLADELWTLSRTTPDASPLEFAQRFTGRFSDDHRTIRGAWEAAQDGADWHHDFELIYRREG